MRHYVCLGLMLGLFAFFGMPGESSAKQAGSCGHLCLPTSILNDAGKGSNDIISGYDGSTILYGDDDEGSDDSADSGDDSGDDEGDAPTSTPASATGSTSGNAIGDVLCNVVDWFTGTLGQGIASLAVIVLGVGALMGKVTHGMALTTIVGIATIFGAPDIVQELTGQTACYSDGSTTTSLDLP
jgi:type IV secretory pathway VirB2 component (pilin)